LAELEQVFKHVLGTTPSPIKAVDQPPAKDTNACWEIKTLGGVGNPISLFTE